MNTYQTEYRIEYKTVKINGLDIFYRETGPKNSPTILLLHGFPTSSHMFRNLIQKLSDEFHLVAPDYPGYGNSSMPSVDEFDYTFENMTNIIYKFTETIGLEKYSLYMMDYGAPIGFRLFSMQPEKVQAFIIQNGNAYDEGLGEFWNPIKDWWNNKTLENEKKLHYLVTEEATKWQYTNGTRNSQLISPDNWVIDQASLNRPGNAAIQLAMLYDYKTNPSLYSQWQENFRKYQPPTLIVWGKNDYIFPESGTHPYKRDLKDIETYILDTGHFALEEDCDLIANKISSFFSSRPEIKADKKENIILVTSELDNNTVEDVKIQKDFISDLQNAAAKANNEILLSNIAKQVGGFKNPWAVFAKYNDAVDERIAQEISPKWEDKLGGVRDVIKSHGFAMSEAGRIDPTAQVLLHDSTFIYR